MARRGGGLSLLPDTWLNWRMKSPEEASAHLFGASAELTASLSPARIGRCLSADCGLLMV